MTTGAGQAGRFGLSEEIRDSILAAPGTILDDDEVMRALIAAGDAARGANVIDLRGAALHRMEERLGQLQDTHRSVISAAYENLAGTNLIHRAVLHLLDAHDLGELLIALAGPVAQILRVDSLRLVLESRRPEAAADLLDRVGPVLVMVPVGQVQEYVASPRPVRLRRVNHGVPLMHGAVPVRSEAVLRLDPGPGLLPGMLVLGAVDPEQFRARQGIDLLVFLAGVLERLLRRELA